MLLLKTVQDYLLELAAKIKKARIASEMTQKELAQKAGIPLSTYRRIEQKGEGSIKDLVKICIALGRIVEFENLLDDTLYSPVEEYEKRNHRKERKRVRHGTQS